MTLNTDGIKTELPAHDTLFRDAGITEWVSHYSVAETLDRLAALLTEKGIKVFAWIDQKAEAE